MGNSPQRAGQLANVRATRELGNLGPRHGAFEANAGGPATSTATAAAGGYAGQAGSLAARLNGLGPDDLLGISSLGPQEAAQARDLQAVSSEWKHNTRSAVAAMRAAGQTFLAGRAPDYADRTQHAAGVLMQHIANAPPARSDLWRGDQMAGSVDDLARRFQPGTQFMDALRSTSARRDTAEHFAREGADLMEHPGGGGKRTSVLVRYEAGAKALHIEPLHNAHSYEGERGGSREWVTSGQYEVVGFDRGGGLGRSLPTLTLRQVGSFAPASLSWSDAPGQTRRSGADVPDYTQLMG